MTQRKNIVHPNFFLGLLSYASFFIAAMLISYNIAGGKTMAIITLLLSVIHWVWGLIDAWTDRNLKTREVGNFFWFELILLIPPLAGLMYYMINNKRVRL
jgi:hypothetical protein